MKQSLLNPVPIITVLLLFAGLTACKKGPDIWGPDCGPCPPVPRCQTQQKLMYYKEENGEYSLFDFPKIKKTFAANGTVSYFQMSLPPFAPIGGERRSLDVTYRGNYVYLFNNSDHDTVLVAKLDPCGKPIWSEQHFSYGGPPIITHYSYNAQGRLIRTQFDHINSIFDDVRFSYDRYGNLLKYYLAQQPAHRMEFTYDYKHPIKGGSYDFENNVPMQGMALLAALGHIDFEAHHLLTSIRDHGEYPFDNRDYYNQVINAAGYVTSYDFTFFSPDNHARNIITWSCGKPGGGHPKY